MLKKIDWLFWVNVLFFQWFFIRLTKCNISGYDKNHEKLTPRATFRLIGWFWPFADYKKTYFFRDENKGLEFYYEKNKIIIRMNDIKLSDIKLSDIKYFFTKKIEWLFWINFLFMQWFFIRLAVKEETIVEKTFSSRIIGELVIYRTYSILFFVWPLTGWKTDYITIPRISKLRFFDLTVPKKIIK